MYLLSGRNTSVLMHAKAIHRIRKIHNYDAIRKRIVEIFYRILLGKYLLYV